MECSFARRCARLFEPLDFPRLPRCRYSVARKWVFWSRGPWARALGQKPGTEMAIAFRDVDSPVNISEALGLLLDFMK